MYMVVIFRTRYVGRSCAYLDSCADDLYRYISISREKNQDVHLSVLVRVGGKKQLMRSPRFLTFSLRESILCEWYWSWCWYDII